MAGTGLALGAPLILGGPAAAQARTHKIALIGCGGRGRGAVQDSLDAAKILGCQVQVVAMADWFRDRAVNAGKQFGVPEERCYGGPRAYQEVMAGDAEIVMIVGAPLFRPLHLEAAIRAGKHVFMEKPVAVDPPGCRRVIAASEEAKRKGLIIVAGTERRHMHEYRETHQALVVEQQLGKLYGGRISFSIGHMFWTRPINPKTPDDLVRTWQNWQCLSGDHIVEQHVHNIDTALWFCGRPPVSAIGFGGRARRNAGDMYDNFSVDFNFGDGLHIHSVCRQINGCWNWDGQDFVFANGHSNGSDYPKPKTSAIPADQPKGPSDHVQEQIDVLYSVQKGKPLDEARAVAESTAAAVMGRISAYTGKEVFWDEVMGNPDKKPDLYNLALHPTAEEFETGGFDMPTENVVPLPGLAQR
ncbi:MAG: Gfo/Idh/MocA family oxidoreductase [Armatimonadetes bacterium]|nr:Gfo/Idh/MocA family oxidoreductase [Armatimonadota bacterium]